MGIYKKKPLDLRIEGTYELLCKWSYFKVN
jgi:hypothetical protein